MMNKCPCCGKWTGWRAGDLAIAYDPGGVARLVERVGEEVLSFGDVYWIIDPHDPVDVKWFPKELRSPEVDAYIGKGFMTQMSVTLALRDVDPTLPDRYNAFVDASNAKGVLE